MKTQAKKKAKKTQKFFSLPSMNYSQVKDAFEWSKDDSTTKYKRCGHYIVQLFKTSETKTNENRKNVKNPMFAKFRASQFLCGKILDTKRKCFVVQIEHKWGSTEITYETGEVIIPDGWTANIEEICGHGIHFFNSLLAAYLYHSCYCLWNDDGSPEHPNMRCPNHPSNDGKDCAICILSDIKNLQ